MNIIMQGIILMLQLLKTGEPNYAKRIVSWQATPLATGGYDSEPEFSLFLLTVTAAALYLMLTRMLIC